MTHYVPTREYTNGEIFVHWFADKCEHCGLCQKGLPQVFNPDARPWVNMQAATSSEIRYQVQQCPTEALMVK